MRNKMKKMKQVCFVHFHCFSSILRCLTCTPEARTDPKKRAGVCLACSYNCHDSHELIELYTKRSFRCDCGTAKILAVRCKLDSVKLDQNCKNYYNQNFSGLYCTCHRPYPGAFRFDSNFYSFSKIFFGKFLLSFPW